MALKAGRIYKYNILFSFSMQNIIKDNCFFSLEPTQITVEEPNESNFYDKSYYSHAFDAFEDLNINEFENQGYYFSDMSKESREDCSQPSLQFQMDQGLLKNQDITETINRKLSESNQESKSSILSSDVCLLKIESK